jgi:hypothetical protein
MQHEHASPAGVEAVDTPAGQLTIAGHTGELDMLTTGVHGLRIVMVNVYSIAEAIKS